MVYEVRQLNGLWWVYFGDVLVTRGFEQQEIADDFATALNSAREQRLQSA